MQNETTNTAEATNTAVTTMKQSFHFRSFPAPTLATVPAGIKPATKVQAEELAAHPECFDSVETAFKTGTGAVHNLRSYKRKSVENVEITLPGFIASMQDPLAKEILTNYVLRFIKVEYIDQFKPVGAHDWETISKAAAEARAARPSGSNIPEVSDGDRAIAGKFFLSFMTAVAPKFAPCVSGWIEAKCTHARTEKTLGNVTKPRAENLQARVQQALEAIAEATAEGNSLTPEQVEQFRASKAGLELAAEMIKRFIAVKWQPIVEVSDDEM